MFKENINHFFNFIVEETEYREKKMALSVNNKKRTYYMFSLAYLFIFLLIFKISGGF